MKNTAAFLKLFFTIYFLLTQQAKLSLHYLIFKEQLQYHQLSFFIILQFFLQSKLICQLLVIMSPFFLKTVQTEDILPSLVARSNVVFIDQLVLIFKYHCELIFITLKSLSQHTLRASCISEQTEDLTSFLFLSISAIDFLNTLKNFFFFFFQEKELFYFFIAISTTLCGPERAQYKNAFKINTLHPNYFQCFAFTSTDSFIQINQFLSDL